MPENPSITGRCEWRACNTRNHQLSLRGTSTAMVLAAVNRNAISWTRTSDSQTSRLWTPV
jgi:hypothetical protein